MTVQSELTVVGRTLLADGHFDNEPDAVLAAIWLLAFADALERQQLTAVPAPAHDHAPCDATGAAPHGA